ncbi:MAG: ABC transporter permease [Oscillibacter sp.]|nr:ABC transporter permease [Oscillibacter sp.]
MSKQNKPQTRQKKAWFSALLDSEKWNGLTIPMLTILLTLVAASIILLVMGKNPLVAFLSFLQGSGFFPKASYGGGQGILTDLFNFMNILAPMILAALAFVVGFKAGLFNIGIAGQMLASGFLATVIIGYSGLSAVLAKPLVLVIGIVAGGLLGALVGWLKYKFNIHEVVSTIMLNYIISYLCGFFINTYFADSLTRSSKICSDSARLTWTNVNIGGVKCNLPLGIVLAVAAAFLVKFIFDRTVFGFELKAVGTNVRCARYTGINVGRRLVFSMAFSGMLAGLAGVTYYCGYYNTIVPKSLASMGYDAISVALLGNSAPIGAIFAGILITIFQYGSNYMSSTVGVPKEIASLITGILLLFSACGGYFRYMAHRRLEREKDEEIEASRAAKSAGEPAESPNAENREKEGKL